MSEPTLIFDPNSGGDVEANLDFAVDALTIFDRNGRTLQRWPYAEIMHAFAPGNRDAVLAHASRPEIRMQVRDDAVYEALRVRAPQLRKLRRGWKTFWSLMEGLPDEARVGIWIAAGLAVFALYRYVAGWFE